MAPPFFIERSAVQRVVGGFFVTLSAGGVVGFLAALSDGAVGGFLAALSAGGVESWPATVCARAR